MDERIFIKKYWDEEDILFYIDFKKGRAIRQIEISKNKKICLTLEKPQQDNSLLYDQSFDDLDIEESDIISEEEFNRVWIS